MPSRMLPMTLGLMAAILLSACASPYDGVGKGKPAGLAGLSSGRAAGR